jgi:hypothetical protein
MFAVAARVLLFARFLFARLSPGRVDAQFVVLFNLLRREQAAHHDMRGEVCGAQLSLQSGDLSGRGAQLVLVNVASRKHRVKVFLTLHDAPAEPHGLAPHPFKCCPRLSPLFGRKPEFDCHLQNVTRAGVVIQFGGHRQPHATTVQ